MVVGSLLGAFVVAEEVIAASPLADQPPASVGSFPTTLVLLLLAPLSAALIARFDWLRLSGAPARPAVLAPEASFGLVALMLLLGMIGSWLTLKAFGIDVDGEWTPTVREQAVLALGAYTAQAAVLAAWLSVLAGRRGVVAGADDPRPALPRAIGIGAIAIVVAWPLVNAAGWFAAIVVRGFGGPPPREIAHDTLELLLDSAVDGWYALLAALVVVAAPVLEELMYRGLLQDGLRRFGLRPWPAIAATSVAFALMHWDNTAPHAVVGLFVLSLGFGWALERTGRLATPIVMHVLFNAGNLGVALALG